MLKRKSIVEEKYYVSVPKKRAKRVGEVSRALSEHAKFYPFDYPGPGAHKWLNENLIVVSVTFRDAASSEIDLQLTLANQLSLNLSADFNHPDSRKLKYLKITSHRFETSDVSEIFRCVSMHRLRVNEYDLGVILPISNSAFLRALCYITFGIIRGCRPIGYLRLEFEEVGGCEPVGGPFYAFFPEYGVISNTLFSVLWLLFFWSISSRLFSTIETWQRSIENIY